jgi:pSer/pThr/pTyr-binding forkhead associated (FHA) protein
MKVLMTADTVGGVFTYAQDLAGALDADVVLDDPGVSRRHAEIRVRSEGPQLQATLHDLGSTNGTFVNGERAGAVQLADGAAITLGRTRAVYRSGER